MKFAYISSMMLLCISLLSCSSKKTSLAYFEDLTPVDTAFRSIGDFNVRIVPEDKLLINVSSSNPDAASLYNTYTPNANGSASIPALPTYIVNSKGDIDFPQLGIIHVAGLTTMELADTLQTMVGKYIIDPRVFVQLLNFRVSVLGEVNRAGLVSTDREHLTLMEAIASAGDLTAYGDREKILLIRDDNGKREVHHINLNNKDILASPYYYLRQNDVIVVQPNKQKEDNSRINPYNSYRLQVASSITGVASIIASLIIALTVK